MPGSYVLDISLRLVLSRAWGVLTAEELLAHASALGKDPRFEPDFNQLSDLRDVRGVALASPDIRDLARLNPFGAGARRAIVSATDEVFGLSRMYEMVRDQPSDEIIVFRDLPPALEWLGLSGRPELSALLEREAERVFDSTATHR